MTSFLKLLLLSICLLLPTSLMAQADQGGDSVGKLKATLYIGTDGDVAALGELGEKLNRVDDATAAKLRGIAKMKFAHYRSLGTDTQPVLRSYENWLRPLNPSKEILLSYESKGLSGTDGLRLDLELWQQSRKLMKTDPVLKLGKPLLILGPKWRGGQLIIAVELIHLNPRK